MTRKRIVTEEQVEEAIDIMSKNGIPLKAACDQLGIGNHYAAVLWNVNNNERLSQLDARARVDYLRVKVRSMNDIVDSETDCQKARLKCDNIKWEAARVARKEFGDRLSLDHSGEIQTLSDDEVDRRIELFTKKLNNNQE